MPSRVSVSVLALLVGVAAGCQSAPAQPRQVHALPKSPPDPEATGARRVLLDRMHAMAEQDSAAARR